MEDNKKPNEIDLENLSTEEQNPKEVVEAGKKLQETMHERENRTPEELRKESEEIVAKDEKDKENEGR